MRRPRAPRRDARGKAEFMDLVPLSKTKPNRRPFAEHGLKLAVETVLEEIRALYCSDAIPWVVGYSGGKDSTAVLTLVWLALLGLEPEKRAKPVHVISTDTRVENPVVAAWVDQSLVSLGAAAQAAGLPVEAHRLVPEVKDSFWVNLIGRGYAAPRPKFRWCTERLKIRPSNRFIQDVVARSGEAVLVLGTRKAESAARARTMRDAEARRVRDRLSPNGSLPNSLVYTPIEDWSNDEVWVFLMQYRNPWGINNKDLLTMYRGATEDGECPLVVDASTPSCGDSRFGCWVCTMVDRDRSMQAMIQNDEEKEWMLPMLALRDELGRRDDREVRDFRRMSGRVQLFYDAPIPGPYVQRHREYLLRRVLEVEQWVRSNGPQYVRELELLSLAELEEIRRIWVIEKHEFEDSLPRIYEAVRGERYPGQLEDGRQIGAEELEMLREICDGDDLHYEMVRELLDVEWRHRTKARRAGLFEDLERAIQRSFYDDEADATAYARHRVEAKAVMRAELENRLTDASNDDVE